MKILIELVDFNDFKAESCCLLNPNFGEASIMVMGADADFVIDNKIIDIKTISSNYVTTAMFHQIIGYYLLGRVGGIGDNKIDGTMIENIGFYFSRHGILKLYNINDIIKKKQLTYVLTQFKSIAKKYNPFICMQDAEKKLDELYFEIWKFKLSTLKSKKHVWNILKQTHEYTKPSNIFYENELTWSSLVQPVKYPKSLNDFCKEVENDTLKETIGRLDSYFTHSNIFLILKICEIENPDWDDFGLPAQAKDQFMEIYCRKKAEYNLKSLYFEMWQHKLSNLKSKKHVWNILKQTHEYIKSANVFYDEAPAWGSLEKPDEYPKSLNAYYREVKNDTLKEATGKLDYYFTYSNIFLILKICEIENPDWDDFGLPARDKDKIMAIYHRKKVERYLKTLYFEMWQHKLSMLKSKKHVWNILKQTSGYSKSLTTFYKDVGNCELTDTIKLLNDHFIYPNILLILKLCEIEYPDWDELGLMPSDAKKFQNMYALN